MERRLHTAKRKGVTRFLSFCLALATLAVLLPAVFAAGGLQAAALDYSKVESKATNRWESYFLRTVMSVSIKDAYDTGVLASVTAGQALYEGGIGGYPISIIAQNHFGIKAYANWPGKVFEHDDDVLYSSYADAKLVKPDGSFWRAYDSLEESIADHSALFHGDDRYIPVLEAKNYKEAAYAIQDSGYAGSSKEYASTLIRIIESWDFPQLDEVTTDDNGVYGMIMDRSRVTLDVGDTLNLSATAYPVPKKSIDVTWTSDRPEVATVDQNGKVTALRQGFTLITASYNGREAVCVVEVDANGYVLLRDTPVVYASPDSSSNTLAKLSPGQAVKVISKELYYGPDGTAFYAVSASPATTSDGQPVSGYFPASGIYTGDGVRLAVGTDSTVLYTSVGDSTTIPLTIYAEELQDKPVAWSSSDESVVTVDQNGKISCVGEGVSVISVTIDGNLALTVTVYVGSTALKSLVATASVNLRTAPSTGSAALGVIQKGQEVKLVNDPGNGWYRILAVIGGHMMEGYASASYFTEPGKNPGVDPGVTPSPPVDGDTPTVTYQKGRVNVDDSLNVRDSASTSGKVVAKLKNNDEVVILETVNTDHSSYPVWYRIRFTYRGETTFGYVAADFIIVTGTVTEPAPGGLSGVYGLEDLYITSIPAGTTLAAFRGNCTPTVRVYREDGKELSDGDVIYTGDTVRVYKGSEVSYVRLAVVTGDVDGDGEINSMDYLLLKRAVLGTVELQSAKERAALVSGQSTVSASDYMIIKRAVLGTYTLK